MEAAEPVTSGRRSVRGRVAGGLGLAAVVLWLWLERTLLIALVEGRLGAEPPVLIGSYVVEVALLALTAAGAVAALAPRPRPRAARVLLGAVAVLFVVSWLYRLGFDLLYARYPPGTALLHLVGHRPGAGWSGDGTVLALIGLLVLAAALLLRGGSRRGVPPAR